MAVRRRPRTARTARAGRRQVPPRVLLHRLRRRWLASWAQAQRYITTWT